MAKSKARDVFAVRLSRQERQTLQQYRQRIGVETDGQAVRSLIRNIPVTQPAQPSTQGNGNVKQSGNC